MTLIWKKKRSFSFSFDLLFQCHLGRGDRHKASCLEMGMLYCGNFWPNNLHTILSGWTAPASSLGAFVPWELGFGEGFLGRLIKTLILKEGNVWVMISWHTLTDLWGRKGAQFKLHAGYFPLYTHPSPAGKINLRCVPGSPSSNSVHLCRRSKAWL